MQKILNLVYNEYEYVTVDVTGKLPIWQRIVNYLNPFTKGPATLERNGKYRIKSLTNVDEFQVGDVITQAQLNDFMSSNLLSAELIVNIQDAK